MKSKVTLLALSLMAILLIPCVYCASYIIYIANDFNEAHWNVTTGYAVFQSNSITLISSTTSSEGKIEYYQTLDQTPKANNTSPTKVYVYFKVNVTWLNSSVVQYVNFIFASASKQYRIGFLNDKPNNKYYFVLKQGDNETKAEITEIPTECILSTDGQYGIYYDKDGNVIKAIEGVVSESLPISFKDVAISIWKAEQATFTKYCISNTLEGAKSQASFGSTENLITAFLPIIITVALLSVCLGFIKKVGR